MKGRGTDVFNIKGNILGVGVRVNMASDKGGGVMRDFIVGAETLEDLITRHFVIGDEVVRCKDCKYFISVEGWTLCKAWDDIFTLMLKKTVIVTRQNERTFR